MVTALTVASGVSAKPRTGCDIEDPFGGTPVAVGGALDPSLLASFAVLRRPAAAADQPPPVNSLAEQVVEIGRYDPAYIRQLGQRSGGRRMFLVPGYPRHVEIPPARCLPPSLRAQRRKLVQQQRQREREPIACVATTSPQASVSQSSSAAFGVGFYGYESESCPRFGDVTKYTYLAISPFGSAEHAGILPDAIAALQVHFTHAPTLQVPVTENYYFYKTDPAPRAKVARQTQRLFGRLSSRRRSRTKADRRRIERQLLALSQHAVSTLTPSSIELLAADGRVIKDVRRPKQPESRSGVTLAVPAPSAG